VNGAITDTSNAVIPSARVTVTNVDTGIQREAASDAAGFRPAGTIGSGSRPDDTRPGAELMVNGNREMSKNFTLDGWMFGASLGGPVIHNKVFFADYEGLRKQQDTVTSVNTVPTAAERMGDFSAVRPIYDPASVVATPGTASGYTRTEFPGGKIPSSRFDSVTSRLIQAYPLPTLPGLVGNQFTNPVLGQQYDQGDARVDYAMSSKDTVFGRFSRQDTRTQTPSTFGFRNVPGVSIPLNLGNSGTYAGTNNQVAYNAVAALTHTFSPSFLGDFRMGFSRFNMHNLDAQAPSSGPGLGTLLGVPYSNQLPQANGMPIFSPSGYTGIGGPASIPTIRLENTFNPVASFTNLRGNHTLKFGTSLVRRQHRFPDELGEWAFHL
jgi:hypothetical protein